MQSVGATAGLAECTPYGYCHENSLISTPKCIKYQNFHTKIIKIQEDLWKKGEKVKTPKLKQANSYQLAAI